jgi:hypothetical protein
MAILTSSGLLGSIQNLSFFQNKEGKTIVRSKGGASKKKIKRAPSFERTRENNSMFAGCARTVRNIRRSFFPLTHMADYNFTPALHSAIKEIQMLDDKGERGQLNVYLSRFAQPLSGFQLRRENTFDSIVRHPVMCTINSKGQSARIEVPALIPGINFFLPWNAPFYRFTVTLGAVTDTLFDPKTKCYAAEGLMPGVLEGEWRAAAQKQAAHSFELAIGELPAKGAGYALIASIGIEMGTPANGTTVEAVPYQGAAKILKAE